MYLLHSAKQSEHVKTRFQPHRSLKNCFAFPFSASLLICTFQAFLACGALVILFELVMMRFLLGRFGTKMPVRAATLIIVPVTALIPSLSSLQGEGSLLTFAVVAALFAIYSCLDLVGGEVCT